MEYQQTLRSCSSREIDCFELGQNYKKIAEEIIAFQFPNWGRAALCYRHAAKHFSNNKSWTEAVSAYVMAAKCHMKSFNEDVWAAFAFANAAWCYKKLDVEESIHCLDCALSLCLKIGDYHMIACCYQEMAGLYEANQNLEQAIVYYHRAADCFQNVNMTCSAILCRLEIAKISAILERYKEAVEIFEEIVYQSLNAKIRTYGIEGHLFDAGICRLCEGKEDTRFIRNALKEYQDMPSTFSSSQEYQLLIKLADAIDENDLAKFVDTAMEFSVMTGKLDPWRSKLLNRAEQAIKQKQ